MSTSLYYPTPASCYSVSVGHVRAAGGVTANNKTSTKKIKKSCGAPPPSLSGLDGDQENLHKLSPEGATLII